MTLAERLNRAMIEKGVNQTRLARMSGVSQPTIHDLLTGTQKSTKKLGQIASALDLAPGDLDPNFADTTQKAIQNALGVRDLKVFAAVEGGVGEILISPEPIDLVPRPWYLGEVKDGYAVMVVGESMSPAFEPGDLAIVNPRIPPMKGKTHIFIAETVDGSWRAMLKRLESWSATEWHLLQFNPAEGQNARFSVQRSEWRQCLRVVGRYESP